MRIFTSYFYMVRFLKPNQIPISTAKWDPKWFHEFKSQDHIFVDKRGIINGLRAERLHPDGTCDNLCSGKPCSYTPESCKFLTAYSAQLARLDINSILNGFSILANRIQRMLKFTDSPEIILLVHEAPTNQCSERLSLQKAFNCCELT